MYSMYGTYILVVLASVTRQVRSTYPYIPKNAHSRVETYFSVHKKLLDKPEEEETTFLYSSTSHRTETEQRFQHISHATRL